MAKLYLDDDELLARELAKDFNSSPMEVSTISPKITKDNLADPELEIVDPTPNIHALFLHFNKRFFWDKLNMVEVKWSPRMTSCAGVCSYQGRGGLCSIRLSQPLLTLRSRQDLVETLLHEMIHAYLFVTHNDRDRDGHGPNFQQHMNRINREAGIKISIYHSFHDEVRHYQTHWWRCNGVCQTRKPFYGTVRRAMNRAPGPSDFWWAQHQANCGGTFIKIKEPAKPEKKKGNNFVKNHKDIRDFFPSSSSQSSNIVTMKDIGISNGESSKKLTNSKPTSNIQTFDSIKKPSIPGGAATANKGSGTLVITQNRKTKQPNSESTKIQKPSISASTTSSNDNKDVRDTVRNIWANKFNSPKEQKKPKLETNNKISEAEAECIEIGSDSDDNLETFDCPLCRRKCPNLDELVLHASTCDGIKPRTPCPVCNKHTNDLQEHLETCLNSSFESGDMSFESDGDEDEVNVNIPTQYPCPCCMKMIEEQKMNSHVDECLTLKILADEPF